MEIKPLFPNNLDLDASIIIDEDYLVPKKNLIKLFNIRGINKT